MSGKSSGGAKKELGIKSIKRRGVVDRRQAGAKGGKDIRAGKGTKSRSDIVALRYRSRGTWRKVEDD